MKLSVPPRLSANVINLIAFKNVFKPASTSLNVKKRLEGGLELKAGDYHFALRDADGNEVATGTNDTDGNEKSVIAPVYSV